jgi:hypothetical protein
MAYAMWGELALGLLSEEMNKRTQGAYGDYSNQMVGVANSYDPYIQTGQVNLSRLNDAYNHMMQNPTAKMDDISRHFSLSPYESNILSHTQNALNQNAANTGLLGSTSANEALQSELSGDVGKFQDHYVQEGLGQYDKALDGMNSLNMEGLNALENRNKWLQEASLGNVKQGIASDTSGNNMMGGIIGLLASKNGQGESV